MHTDKQTYTHTHKPLARLSLLFFGILFNCLSIFVAAVCNRTMAICKAHVPTPPLQHTAKQCNTLQHTATHCNTLQHTATHCNRTRFGQLLSPLHHHGSTLQHTATHCNALQHTATHCNTLQHVYRNSKKWRQVAYFRLRRARSSLCGVVYIYTN